MKRAEEMTRLMETVESQHQASHSFPQALGNLADSARFPPSLSSDYGSCEWKTKTQVLACNVNRPGLRRGKTITLTTAALHACGLHPYLTQPTSVWVTSLNELTGLLDWISSSGQVAQSVERSPEKAGVGGSIPSLATII